LNDEARGYYLKECTKQWYAINMFLHMVRSIIIRLFTIISDGRLKTRKQNIVPKGSLLNKNNVVKGAGIGTFSTSKGRFPRLVLEIKELGKARKSDQG
jgi:hypothetical protein